MISRTALLNRIPVPRGALALAALLSVLLGGLLFQHFGVASSTAPPPAAGSAGGERAGLSTLPVSALAPVSAALAAGDRAYRFTASGGGFQTANPIQHLSIRAEGSRVLVQSRGLKLGLRLSALGYGSSLHAPGAARLAASGNRITYSRTALSEWYVNGPAGLEQGFTLSRAPAGPRTGALTLAITLAGNSHAALAGDGRGVTIGHAGGSSLHYGELSAIDADGRPLPSRLSVKGDELLLRVDARGARFPLRIDPLVRREGEEKLTAEDEAGEGRFGYHVALSGDGDTALISSPLDNGGAGAAWVFVRSRGSWKQQGSKLVSGEAAGPTCTEETEETEETVACGFGQSIALSADGDTALIGNPREKRYDAARERWVLGAGAVWVFTRSGTTWTQQPSKLTGGEEEAGAGHFGRAVALSGDGDTALVGASADRALAGSAWVFTRSGTTWKQQGAKLTGAGEQGQAHFGASVALSANGETALVGGPGEGFGLGAAWAFTRSGETWSEDGSKLTGGGEGVEGHFGYSVALSADAGTAIVGAFGTAEGAGSAWVFTNAGSSFQQQGEALTGPDEGGEAFGYSVALSADGNTALVGAPKDDGTRGAAWLFKRSGVEWAGEPEKLEAGALQSGRSWFGDSVALSFDAQTALVGARRDNHMIGAAWVFGSRPIVGALNPKKGPAKGGTIVTIKGSSLDGASAVDFGSTAAESFSVESANAITAVAPPGTGTVNVVVTTPEGTSALSAADAFEYVDRRTSGEGASTTSGASTSTTTTTTAGSGVLGFGAVSGGGCGVTLQSRRIIVGTHARAAFKLHVGGGGTCKGQLRLQVTHKVGHRSKTKMIGTGTFSIAAGRSAVIKIKLNAAGRVMLVRHHGHLLATLVIVRQSPGPSRSQTARVRLALFRRHTSTVQVKVKSP